MSKTLALTPVDVLDVLDERASLLADLARTDQTDPGAVDAAHRERVVE